MQQRYIVFDVETPNFANDRISAIGVTVVEDGAIRAEYDTLVDPQARFDRFNMALTGITPDLVAGKPTFPELWRRLGPLMDGGLLVAHNAPFDLSVLAKCLRDYHITWRPTVPYLCTCQMSRRLLPQLPNHKLNTLCQYLEIPLEHHHAGSDSQACGALLCHYLGMGARMEEHIRCFDMQRLRVCHPGKEK